MATALSLYSMQTIDWILLASLKTMSSFPVSLGALEVGFHHLRWGFKRRPAEHWRYPSPRGKEKKKNQTITDHRNEG